jgi:hypothetical protein
MTAVSPEAHAVHQTDAPRSRWLVHRLAALLGRFRSSDPEDVDHSMMHALDQAFRALAREYRR